MSALCVLAYVLGYRNGQMTPLKCVRKRPLRIVRGLTSWIPAFWRTGSFWQRCQSEPRDLSVNLSLGSGEEERVPGLGAANALLLSQDFLPVVDEPPAFVR
jgi:hypothetical protein